MNEILEIDGVFYKHVYDDPKHGCNSCALKKQCDSGIISLALDCDFNHYEEFEPTEEMIKKVLRLSDEADKAFSNSCCFIRRQSGLLPEERIEYIKDHWNEETKKENNSKNS
jgi:hypothetical protein